MKSLKLILLIAIGIAFGIAATTQIAEAKECPKDKEFSTTGDWHGCSCPSGYEKKYLDVFKYKAKCLRASGGHILCPTGKDFSTTGQWHGCSCPSGYAKRYTDQTLKAHAVCMKTDAGGSVLCPNGQFNTTGRWHDCKCPSGTVKGYTNQVTKADAVCMKTDPSGRLLCPNDKHFSTTGELRGCRCPDGYWKEYDDSLAFSKASCVSGDKPRSEDAQCKAKGGRWVGGSGHHARGFCIPCRDADCVDAVANPLYHAYKIYFAAIGSGATMRNLPPYVQDKLKPYFPPALLKVIQYGASKHTAGNAAMTDCTKIYFPASSQEVKKINEGKMDSTAYHWLIHELTHSKQCYTDSQVRYAETWFGQLGITTIEQIVKNPTTVSTNMIHNKMPMEKEAAKNADSITNKLSF